MFKVIKKCRICGNENLQTVMNLGEQVLTGVFPKTRDEKLTSGPVELVQCVGHNVCGLVQLKQSYDLNEMYGMNYGYRSGLNPSMVAHLHSKVDKIIALEVLKSGDLIIDIGSNDATTLRAYPADKYELVGVDPTGIKFATHYPPEITLIADFFSAKVIRKALPEKKAKVITSFSMFYDLEDPINFAKEIERCLDDEGVWIFEQSYLPAMLQSNSFDTICHEHLEFYSLKQINWIAEEAGLKVLDVEFNEINGGSFSVTVAKRNSMKEPKLNLLDKIIADESALGAHTTEAFIKFRKGVEVARQDLLEFLLNAKSTGKVVYGLGASTKGNVLLQYYGINEDLLPLIGEVNEDKFGSFTPGTLIPLLPEKEILELNPDYLLVLPWHFKDFFISLPMMKGKKLVFPLPKLEIINC